jgi:hypothetical protein
MCTQGFLHKTEPLGYLSFWVTSIISLTTDIKLWESFGENLNRFLNRTGSMDRSRLWITFDPPKGRQFRLLPSS